MIRSFLKNLMDSLSAPPPESEFAKECTEFGTGVRFIAHECQLQVSAHPMLGGATCGGGWDRNGNYWSHKPGLKIWRIWGYRPMAWKACSYPEAIHDCLRAESLEAAQKIALARYPGAVIYSHEEAEAKSRTRAPFFRCSIDGEPSRSFSTEKPVSVLRWVEYVISQRDHIRIELLVRSLNPPSLEKTYDVTPVSLEDIMKLVAKVE